MEAEQLSNSEKLMELLSQTFPQFKFPEIDYEERTENNGSISFNARVKLLGQAFSSGPQSSKEVAKETLSSIAYESVKEFNRLILTETDSSLNCEALSSLMRPLKEEAYKVAATPTQDALRSVTAIKNRLIEVENEKINMKVKAKSDKIVEKMQISSPMEVPELVKTAKVEETKVLDAEPVAVKPVAEVAPSGVASISVRPLKIEESEPAKPTSKPKEKERKTNLGGAIPAFYEFVEKQFSKDSIIFEDFNKGYNFGCCLRWGKKFWVAPAEFRQKKDAHNYAAIMACVECFGEGFTYEGVDPRIYYKWTRESVRQASDRYSFGSSDELLDRGNSKQAEPVDLSNIKIEPLSNGRKYVSVINEICQKMRYTPPNFQISSVNALTNYYVCSVRNFHDLPPIDSAPFTKKNDSKEDAAGKIYYLLEQRGIVDAASRIVGRQKAIESASPSRPANAPSKHSTSPPSSSMSMPPMPSAPEPPNAANMMQMMPMFMMSQQMTGGNPQMGFDPLMMQEMMKQWQAFLAWQQQQQYAQGMTQPQAPYSASNANPRPPHSHYHDYNQQRNSHYDERYPPRNNEDSRYPPRQNEDSRYPPRQKEDDRHYSRHSETDRHTPRHHEDDRHPPHQNDNYSGSRKRNYEESRRRYYD